MVPKFTGTKCSAESHTVAQPRVEASSAQQRSRWVLFTPLDIAYKLQVTENRRL